MCSTISGTSYKADPKNCQCYYKCSQGFYQVHLCCENFQHFNPLTEGCDDPPNVNCTTVAVSKEKFEATSEKRKFKCKLFNHC